MIQHGDGRPRQRYNPPTEDDAVDEPLVVRQGEPTLSLPIEPTAVPTWGRRLMREAIKAYAFGELSHLLFSLTPTNLPANEWVTAFDDGDPPCKRVEVTNTSDEPLEVEVTYKEADDGGTPPPLVVQPKSSVLLECHISVLRLRTKRKGTASWDDEASFPSWVIVHGSGPAYRHGPSLGEIFPCKRFRITNTSPDKKITAKLVRVSPPLPGGGPAPDEKKDIEVQPGNSIIVRCKIVSIDIVGPPDATSKVEELHDYV